MGAEARARRGNPWSTVEERTLLARVILWLVDVLRAPVTAFGVEHRVFRELLRVRVVLGIRPSKTAASVMGTAGAALVVTMVWFTGIGTGIVALTVKNPVIWVTVSLSVLMFLLAMLLFQVVAGILVDPTDIGVVAAHPIRDRTVFAVRLAEAGLHVLVISAAFAAGNVMIAVFGQPPLAVLLVFPVLTLLAGATTLGLVALMFAVILRIVGPTHFQRVTLWAQIVGGALFLASGQLPRLVPRGQWGLWKDQLQELRFLWPPFQYAEVFELALGRAALAEPLAVVAAFLLPAAVLAATFALASRYFVAGLQGTLGAPRPRAAWPQGLVDSIGRRLVSGVERHGYDFTAALSRREPGFLRGVLPQLAMFQVMSLGMSFSLNRDSRLFIPFSAAFLFMVLPNVLTQAQSTATPDARTLFSNAPLADEGAFLRGGVKALLVQWFALPALLLVCVQLLVVGLEALPRIVLAFARHYRLRLFFTLPVRVGEGGSANLGLVILSGFAMLLLVGAHFALSLHPLALAGGIVLTAGLLRVLWRRLEGMRPVKERAATESAS